MRVSFRPHDCSLYISGFITPSYGSTRAPSHRAQLPASPDARACDIHSRYHSSSMGALVHHTGSDGDWRAVPSRSRESTAPRHDATAVDATHEENKHAMLCQSVQRGFGFCANPGCYYRHPPEARAVEGPDGTFLVRPLHHPKHPNYRGVLPCNGYTCRGKKCLFTHAAQETPKELCDLAVRLYDEHVQWLRRHLAERGELARCQRCRRWLLREFVDNHERSCPGFVNVPGEGDVTGDALGSPTPPPTKYVTPPTPPTRMASWTEEHRAAPPFPGGPPPICAALAAHGCPGGVDEQRALCQLRLEEVAGEISVRRDKIKRLEEEGERLGAAVVELVQSREAPVKADLAKLVPAIEQCFAEIALVKDKLLEQVQQWEKRRELLEALDKQLRA